MSKLPVDTSDTITELSEKHHQIALCDIPVALMPDLLLAISFQEGAGRYAAQAAALARGAHFHTFRMGMHVCAFKKSLEGALRAIAILDYVGQTRGCHCYTGSPMLWGPGRVKGVLHCYTGALNCDHRDAWCYTVQGGILEMLAGLPIRELPCKKVVGYFCAHLATWKDVPSELQAAAIEAGVEWCPCWKDRIRGLVKL